MNNPTPLPTLPDVVRDMFLAVAPERAAELQRYWNEYSPQFQVLEDDGSDGPIVLDAGGFVYIRFNHRVMRLFWLASFALWEDYAAYQHYVSTQEANLTLAAGAGASPLVPRSGLRTNTTGATHGVEQAARGA